MTNSIKPQTKGKGEIIKKDRLITISSDLLNKVKNIVIVQIVG